MPVKRGSPEPLLTPEDVAAILQRDRRWVVQEFVKDCPPVPVGKPLRWRPSRVEETLDRWEREGHPRHRRRKDQKPKPKPTARKPKKRQS